MEECSNKVGPLCKGLPLVVKDVLDQIGFEDGKLFRVGNGTHYLTFFFTYGSQNVEVILDLEYSTFITFILTCKLSGFQIFIVFPLLPENLWIFIS